MATVKVYKYKFGNYLDTRVANVSDLETHFDGIEPLETFENINFSFNDGLNATIVLPIQDSDINEVNYLTVEIDDEIKPYFILSYVYNLQNQYTVALKFDSVLANLEIIKNSTANVSRAFIPDTDKRIFNNEGIEVTQIKQYEIPIQRKIIKLGTSKENIGWYAVFADSKLGSTNDVEDKLVLRTQSRTVSPSATYATMADIPFYDYIDNDAYFLNLKESHLLQNMTYYATNYPGARLEYKGEFARVVNSNSVTAYSNYSYTKSVVNVTTTYAYKLDALNAFNYIKGPGPGEQPSYTHPGLVLPNSTSPIPTFSDSTFINKFNTVAASYNTRQFQITEIDEINQKSYDTLIANKDKIIKVNNVLYKIIISDVLTDDQIVFAANVSDNIDYLRNQFVSPGVRPDSPTDDALNVQFQLDSLGYNGDLSTKYPNWHFPGDNYPRVNHVISMRKVSISLEKVDAFTTNELITFDGSSEDLTLEATASDAPYKILLFPYGNMKYKKAAQSYTNLPEYSNAIVHSVVSNLITDYAGGTNPRIYDVQKIPYSTIDISSFIRSAWKESLVFQFDETKTLEKRSNGCYHVNKDQKLALVFFNAINSTHKFNVDLPDLPGNNVKIDSVSRTARIVSNSLKTSFDFDYVKNKYKASFQISVDLKPINSYFNIDLIADPEGLYYADFSDGRGINIAEDFSVTQTSDAYLTYQRENFNYLNSFNSQQQYQSDLLAQQQSNQDAELALKARQSWEKFGVNAGANILISGVIGGAVKGGGVGAGLGFLGGAIKAGADAASNALAINQEQRLLALNQSQARGILTLDQAQAREQFDFRIKNVQALANRLDKVSGITVLDKRTPFIAMFATTSEEEYRLSQFFKYNAYNINTIDTLASYVDILDESYVKATIVRAYQPISNIIMQDINTRLASGIYFVKET